jgi:hypothetical protein
MFLSTPRNRAYRSPEFRRDAKTRSECIVAVNSRSPLEFHLMTRPSRVGSPHRLPLLSSFFAIRPTHRLPSFSMRPQSTTPIHQATRYQHPASLLKPPVLAPCSPSPPLPLQPQCIPPHSRPLRPGVSSLSSSAQHPCARQAASARTTRNAAAAIWAHRATRRAGTPFPAGLTDASDARVRTDGPARASAALTPVCAGRTLPYALIRMTRTSLSLTAFLSLSTVSSRRMLSSGV